MAARGRYTALLPTMPSHAMPRSTLLLLAGLLAGASAQAGLPDAGLLAGAWRSDLPSPLPGTAAEPLTYDGSCPFPSSRFAICPGRFTPIPGVQQPQPARVFPRSNWQDRTRGRDRFWVVSANVEPALDPNCNSGPPNQSEAVGQPFGSVFGVAVQPAPSQPWRNEVVLAVDLSHRPRQLTERPACRTRDYVPFLGFGAFSGRGAGEGPLAVLGAGAAPLLRFDLRLVDSNARVFGSGEPVPPAPRGQYAGVIVEAQWGGLKRWVWIDLLNAFALPAPSVRVPWNWTVRDSVYYPGAEIVFTSGDTLRRECGTEGLELPAIAPATLAHGRPVPVRLDLERLFACTAPLFGAAPPPGPLPVTSVNFFVEVGVREHDGRPGLSVEDWDSRLGIAVSAVDLVAGDSPLSDDARFLAQLSGDLAGQTPEAGERARMAAQAAVAGRTAAALTLLDSAAGRTARTAARLVLVAHGNQPHAGALDAVLAHLRSGGSERTAAALLAGHPAFRSATQRLGHAALAERVFGHALDGGALTDEDAAAFGTPDTWADALAAGDGAVAELLLAGSRLAVARGTLARKSEVVVLYRAFLGVPPASGGIAAWKDAAAMPGALVEALYYAPPYRRRFE